MKAEVVAEEKSNQENKGKILDGKVENKEATSQYHSSRTGYGYTSQCNGNEIFVKCCSCNCHIYAKYGSINRACELFGIMPKKKVITW